MPNPIRSNTLKILITACCSIGSAHAVDWSDTFIGYRYGEQFREPNNPNEIAKHVLQLGHVNGYSLGQNFINLDILKSDSNDPAKNSRSGATEFYLTYRHQLQFGKAFGKDMSFGPVKDVALTAGFDLNTKNTIVSPRKRLFVIGPTLRFDVPGFLDVSLLAGRESNRNQLGKETRNIDFDPQLILSTSWGIPFEVGSTSMKFQGFLNYLSEKGKDYNGVNTAPETLMRTSLMVDVGKMANGRKNQFYMGIGYEYWNNKFGYSNRSVTDNSRKQGIRTTTPTLQAELHF